MRNFEFRFQKILDYREHLETQEKHKFAKVLKKYLSKENEMNENIKKREDILISSKEYMLQNNIQMLRWRDGARNGLKTRIGTNRNELDNEKKNLDEARKILLEFTRKKKVMEKLKEKDLKKHSDESKRLLRKEVNEISNHLYFEKKKEEPVENEIIAENKIINEITGFFDENNFSDNNLEDTGTLLE